MAGAIIGGGFIVVLAIMMIAMAVLDQRHTSKRIASRAAEIEGRASRQISNIEELQRIVEAQEPSDFDVFMEKTGDLVVLRDEDFSILYANGAWSRWLGYDNHLMVGQPVYRFFSEERLGTKDPTIAPRPFRTMLVRHWDGSFRRATFSEVKTSEDRFVMVGRLVHLTDIPAEEVPDGKFAPVSTA